MPWYIWLVIGYFVLDRLGTVASIGRSIEITIEITREFAVLSLITGGLIIWAIVVGVTS